MKKKLKPPSNLWMYIAFAVALSLLLTISLVTNNNEKTAQSPPLRPITGEPLVLPAHAGEVPENFPKELIVDSSSKVTLGDTVKYPDGRTQSSAKFSSNKSVSDLFAAYEAYFKASDWKIVKVVTAGKARTIVARKNDAAGVTVDILAAGRKSDLFINYVAR